jgi:predicted DNA-binding WGR domain protein
MHERLELQDASSHKFWEVTVDGSEMTVTFGRVGAKGQRKTKALASSAAARTEANALIAEKLKKGYRRGGAESASAAAPVPDPVVAAAQLPVHQPAAPAGALPKIKATRYTRLVGAVGEFQAPTRAVALVRGVHVAAGGRRVLLDDRETARVFDLESGALVQRVVNRGGRATLAPDGARMFTWCADARTGAGAMLTCRDVGTGAEIWTAGVHKGPGGSPGPVVISADGATILTGSAVKGQQLQAWSADGALKWSRALGKGDVSVEVIALSPDGLRFATGSTDERIRVWSTGRGEVEHTMPDEAWTGGLRWYPDGERLISSSTHLTAIWTIGKARPSQVLGTYERARGTGDVVLLADGSIAACVGNGQVGLWDAAGVALERLDLKVKTGAWSLGGCPDGVLVGTAAGCALRFRVSPGGS